MTSPFRENLFTAVYLHRIKHLNEMGEFELAGTLEKEIEEGLRRYGEHMAPETRMSFYTALAHMHFGRENYHRALDYNNRILADSEPEIRPIRYYHARLFNLMIHYELGNYSLLEHLIRSTYRYLTIRGATSRFEEIVIAFFRRLLRMRSRRELRRIAEETLTELMLLWYDPLPARGIDYSGFGLWLRRYIEGRTLVELAKEEYAQKQKRVRQMAPQI